MGKIKRFKINGLHKMANGMGLDYYRIENFRYDNKKIFDEKDLNYIIQNDKIHPIHIDLPEKYVFFLEVDSVIDHNRVAFFYEPLQLNAKYIIRVDLDDFINSIKNEKSGNPLSEEKIIFIHHTGRCGSTLLHKILGSHSQIESFSEHLIWNNLFLEKNTKSSDFKVFCKIFLSYLYNKHIGVGDKYLVFKMTGSSAKYLDQLSSILPDVKHIYLTRDPIKISESFYNLYMNVRIGRIRVGYLLKWSGFFYRKRNNIWNMKKGNDDPYGFRVDKHFKMGFISDQIKCIKSANSAELTILRVLITDRQFDHYSRQNLINLINIKYEDILQKDNLFSILSNFIKLKYDFDQSVYDEHSHLNSIGEIAIKKKKYRYSDKRIEELISFQRYARELL